MDIIDIVIQIQQYLPIFDRYLLRLVSKVWKDAYYLLIANDDSQMAKIFQWWKRNGAKNFSYQFDLSLKENVVLGYYDSLMGEIIYNCVSQSLHFISRVFKKAIFLLKWPIHHLSDVETLIVDVGDNDKHVLYIGQTSPEEVLSYVMISIEIRKYHKFSNIDMKSFPNRAKNFMMFRSKEIEYFLQSKTFYYIIPWEPLYFMTNHAESENGNIFIRLVHLDKKFKICPGIKLISVHETKVIHKDLALMRFRMSNNFLSILVSENNVGFYPKPIFCIDDCLIDSDGKFVESVELISNTQLGFSVIDPTQIQHLINKTE